MLTIKTIKIKTIETIIPPQTFPAKMPWQINGEGLKVKK